MTREYMDRDRTTETAITTPFGKLFIFPLDEDTIRVDSARDRHPNGKHGLRVNGVSYHVSGWLHRWEDGSWNFGQEWTEKNGHRSQTSSWDRRHSLTASRMDLLERRDVTDSAREKLLALATIVGEFANSFDGRVLTAKSAVATVNNNIRKAEEEVAKAEAVLAEAQLAVSALKEQEFRVTAWKTALDLRTDELIDQAKEEAAR